LVAALQPSIAGLGMGVEPDRRSEPAGPGCCAPAMGARWALPAAGAGQAGEPADKAGSTARNEARREAQREAGGENTQRSGDGAQRDRRPGERSSPADRRRHFQQRIETGNPQNRALRHELREAMGAGEGPPRGGRPR